MKLPLVSILITTRNSADTLEDLLVSLKKQSYQKIEVIVVDNRSKDQTLAIAKKFTPKVYLKGPERSAQRNYAAQKAGGDYYLILDSDMILTPKVVAECLGLIQEKKEMGAIVIPEQSFGQGFWAKTKALEREINIDEAYLVAARFFPKKVFWEFGGYDEKLTGPEDWDLPRRIDQKYQIGKIKAKILHNEGRPTLIGLAKRKFYYGLSVDKYLRKHQLSIISPTTLYFLRPAFYRHWRKMLSQPIISSGMLIMLVAETIGGGLGYLVGRFRK